VTRFISTEQKVWSSWGDRRLVNIHADILFLVHNGAPFGKCGANNHNLPQSGRLFILREIERFIDSNGHPLKT
jgi:hypothetical protein